MKELIVERVIIIENYYSGYYDSYFSDMVFTYFRINSIKKYF